jgi:hypothetical protein
VPENRLLWRIFETKREKVVRGWRKQHNEELRIFYTSPNIIREIKSRVMRLERRVAFWTTVTWRI